MTLTPTAIAGRRALVAQLWDENPIFRQVLGICSALAVTNLVFNTLLMCAGLIWATALSSATFSLLRNYIPARVRMIIQVLIIAVYVIMVDIAIRAYYPDIYQMIGPYVGLIITNCIVMGRLEAFASKNRVWPSALDGLGSGLGYSFILLSVACVREYLGFGALAGYKVPDPGQLTQYLASAGAWVVNLFGHVEAPQVAGWWKAWTLMIMPPGAFFVLAVAVWIARTYALRREAAAQPKKGGAS